MKLKHMILSACLMMPVAMASMGTASAATDNRPTVPGGKTYSVTIHTSALQDAGTDGTVWLTIDGSLRRSPELGPLDTPADNFEMNSYDRFSFTLQDLGALESVKVCFKDGGGSSAGWLPDYVSVNGVKFGINEWFSKNGNRKYCRSYAR